MFSQLLYTQIHLCKEQSVVVQEQRQKKMIHKRGEGKIL